MDQLIDESEQQRAEEPIEKLKLAQMSATASGKTLEEISQMAPQPGPASRGGFGAVSLYKRGRQASDSHAQRLAAAREARKVKDHQKMGSSAALSSSRAHMA